MSFQSLREAILPKYLPSSQESEQLHSAAQEIVTRFSLALSSHHATVEIGGSVAKDTWIKGTKEVDLFVRFEYKTYYDRSSELSEILESILRDCFSDKQLDRIHGSRDYFHLQHKGIMFEIVPILAIDDAKDARNITDISPLHAVWVNDAGKDCKDDIRLAKALCRAQNLYGAESYISGFSGYVLEILTIHYGSFEALLRAASSWKKNKQTLLDPQGFYKGKDITFELNTSKLQSPLVLIDPVDKSRNAAAALGREKYQEFIALATKLCAQPSPLAFETVVVTKEQAQKQLEGTKHAVLYIELEALEGKRDVVGAKLLKIFQELKRELEEFSFLHGRWQWKPNSSARYSLFFRKARLAKTFVKQGPPSSHETHVLSFKKLYPGAYEQEGIYYAKVERQQRDLQDAARRVLNSEYVQERSKKIKDCEVFSVSSKSQ